MLEHPILQSQSRKLVRSLKDKVKASMGWRESVDIFYRELSDTCQSLKKMKNWADK